MIQKNSITSLNVLILLVSLIFAYPVATAQLHASYKFDHLTSDKGFPAEGVRSMVQDERANFWAITEKGLMRYNGHSGKFYRPTGDSTGLLMHAPWSLFVDQSGMIWISYQDSMLSVLDPLTEKFEHFLPNSAQPDALPAAMISSMFEDSEHRIWIPTWGGGLCLFNRENKSFKVYINDPADSTSISTNVITCVEEDADGTLLVGSWEGGPWLNYMQVFDPETEQFSRFDWGQYRLPPNSTWVELPYHLRIVSLIKRDKENNLWIGTYVGVFHVDRTHHVVSRLEPGLGFKAEHPGEQFHDNIVSGFFTPDGKVWFAAEVGGIMVVDPRTMTYEVLMHKAGQSTSLSSDFIFDTHVGKSGKVFVATANGGIDVYDPIQNQFELISNDQLGAVRFGNQVSYAILSMKALPADSLILIGSGDGLSVYHKGRGLVRKVVPTQRVNPALLRNPDFKLAFFRNHIDHVRGIWVYPEVWLIASASGILKYYPSTDKLDFGLIGTYHFPVFSNQDSSGGYFNAHCYTGDKSPSGEPILENWICRYDQKSDQFSKVKKVSDAFGPAVEYFGYYNEDFVRIDSVHYCVLVSPNCFEIFNVTDSSFKGYGYYPPMQNFPDSLVRPVVADNLGNLWLRGANGLYRFNVSTGKSENFVDQLKLKKNERVLCGTMDKDGILWLGVSQDLIRFNPETGASYRFTKRHGLEIGSHVMRSRIRETGDTMYLPVANGLLYFEPEKITLDTSSVFTGMSSIILNKDTLNAMETEVFLTSSPELSWDQNHITFEFYASEIYASGSKNYYYRLIGFDSTWQSNNANNTAQYTNLQAGEYVFEVYYESSSGMKSPVLQVPFSIQKPFWWRWWFIMLSTLAGIGLLVVLIRYRERKMKKEQERLEQVVQERTQEVREKMNEIELQKEIIEDKNKEMTDSIKYAKRIQDTLLAHEELLKANLPDHFVFFRPKDIVSGDFYWAAKHGDYFYLAICDSTGHGVPGAFMSLLNIRFLNEAIVERNLTQPHEILNFVRERLVANLAAEGARDGMDGVLLRVNHTRTELVYAAAHNNPVMVHKGDVIELPADKIPVGAGDLSKQFSLQTIKTSPGDTIYFFTDGYQDQFGGPKGKKLKYKNLIQILAEISNLDLNLQSAALDDYFVQWKGDLEQLDDVLIVGLKV